MSTLTLQNTVFLSNELSLTMMILDEWSMVYVEGIDAKNFLQNQLTIDINILKTIHHRFCSHCNFNGKVLSTMHIFKYDQGYAYVQRKSVSNMQITELKKYSLFSKVKIKQLNDVVLVGMAGLNVRSLLSSFLKIIPDEKTTIIHNEGMTILWFCQPLERFLLVLSFSDFLSLKNNIDKNIALNNSKQWLSLDIEAGLPIVDQECVNKFTPQAINLDKLKAISFQKGCYYGQETIARIFFKNLNKYNLYCLCGKGYISTKIGSVIKVKIQNKWCKIGFVLSVSNVFFEKTLIQAVLKKPVSAKNMFRVDEFKNLFFIKTI
jgi:folate-binding protein YgfZ